MKLGLSGRLIVSHGLVAVIAIVVFALSIVTTISRQSTRAGLAVDYATAYRMVPIIESVLNAGEAPSSQQNPPPHHRNGMMEMEMEPLSFRAPLPRGSEFGRVPPPLSRLIERPMIVVDRSGTVVFRRGDTPERLPPEVELTDGVRFSTPSVQEEYYLFVGGMIDPRNNPLSEAIVSGTTRAAGIAGIVIIIGAFGVGILWTAIILKPLRDIRDASAAIAGGDLERRVSVPPGNHELADLARGFNEMATEVQSQEETRRQFVGDAAHELRTPLTLTLSRVEMLQQGIYPPDEVQFASLLGDLKRMGNLVDDLQTLARVDAGRLVLQRSDVTLSRITDEACASVRPIAEQSKVTLSTLHTEGGETVSVDPDRFQQIMTNLLTNAIRFTPEGGSVVVETDVTDSYAIVAVEDSGPGIKDEDRERVFERFVRLDAARNRIHGGSGLGLSIAAELVHRHGGEIGVVNPRHSDRGARFEVQLPIEE